MWLRRLVGAVMIITLIGMNSLVIIGILAPPEKVPKTVLEQAVAPPDPVTVKLSAKPGTITKGLSGGIEWSTTGNASSCQASGDWNGSKTPFGAESTGRISKIGDYNYKIKCTNGTSEAEASIKVKVIEGVASSNEAASSTSAPTQQSSGVKYCQGRLPCYGPREIASHGSSGNCWGWNGDKVINISGFDAAFHKSKSGIGSIEIGQVCGKDLAPALGNSVSAGGSKPRDHLQSTKSNSDKNEIPYFVGYYDSSKP